MELCLCGYNWLSDGCGEATGNSHAVELRGKLKPSGELWKKHIYKKKYQCQNVPRERNNFFKSKIKKTKHLIVRGKEGILSFSTPKSPFLEIPLK